MTSGPMRNAPDDGDGAERDHDGEQTAEARAEVGELARTREGGELREQRCLHGLEEEQRHTCDDRARRERTRERLLVGCREQLHGDRSRVDEERREDRSGEEVAEVARELGPWCGRSRFDEVVLTTHRDRDGDERRDANREAVEPDGLDSDERERHTERHADGALAAHVEAVRAEAAHPRERAAAEMAGVVADEAEQEAHEQQPAAVEEVLDHPRADDQREDDEDRGEQSAELRGSPDHRSAAKAIRASVGEGAAHLLLDGEEEAGAGEERDDPHHGKWCERVRTERAGGDREEPVAREARDDEPGPDGDRAFGKRVATNRRRAAVRFGRKASGDGVLLEIRAGGQHRSRAEINRHHGTAC